MGIDKFNHEGYSDPATYEALTNIHREEMAADKKAAYGTKFFSLSCQAGVYTYAVSVTASGTHTLNTIPEHHRYQQQM